MTHDLTPQPDPAHVTPATESILTFLDEQDEERARTIKPSAPPPVSDERTETVARVLREAREVLAEDSRIRAMFGGLTYDETVAELLGHGEQRKIMGARDNETFEMATARVSTERTAAQAALYRVRSLVKKTADDITQRCLDAGHAQEFSNHAYRYVNTLCRVCGDTIRDLRAAINLEDGTNDE